MLKIAKITAEVAITALLLVGTTDSFAAQKPEKTQGLDATGLQQFPLAAQIAVMRGYELRGRRIVVAPGGAVTEHSHADRPGIVYILEGSMTEHRGEIARTVKVGDTWAEDFNTLHWFENTTDKPCVIWAVDIVQKQ